MTNESLNDLRMNVAYFLSNFQSATNYGYSEVADKHIKTFADYIAAMGADSELVATRSGNKISVKYRSDYQPPPNSSEIRDNRTIFEAWAVPNGYPIKRHSVESGNEYWYPQTQDAWNGFQANLPKPVSVAEVCRKLEPIHNRQEAVVAVLDAAGVKYVE